MIAPEYFCKRCKQWFVDPPQLHQCLGDLEPDTFPLHVIHVPTETKTTADAKAYRDRDTLRSALLAIVACPDYRNIQTHEMTRARKALEDTQP